MAMLIGLAALAVVYALVLAYLAVRQRASASELYERIYGEVLDRFYEPLRVPDRERWHEARPKPTASASEVINCANRMLQPLNDPYTYVTARGKRRSARKKDEFVGIGIRLAALYEEMPGAKCSESGGGEACVFPTIIGVFNSSPAKEAGLRIGDLIVSVNGRSTAGRPIAQVLDSLRGGWGRKVVLGIKSRGVTTTVTLRRGIVKNPGASARMIGSKLGYLRIADFDHGSRITAARLSEDLKDAEAVVIDLRENPGGQAGEAFAMAALFISQGLVATAEHRSHGTSHGEVEYETSEIIVEHDGVLTRRSLRGHIYERKELVPKSPLSGKRIALLVNENTASAAELFAGALHDTYGATIYGERTFGKGVGQQTYELPSFTQLIVTTGKYFLPSGNWAGNGADNRIGIEPDVIVKAPDGPFELGSPQDEQLTTACRLFEEKLQSS